LCKGIALPVTVEEARRMLSLEQLEAQAHREDVAALKKTSVEAFWADFNRAEERQMDLRLGALRRAELLSGYESAVRSSQERQVDLASLIDELSNLKNAKKRFESYRVWEALWQADTGSEVLQACGRWNKLPRRYRDELISGVVSKHCDVFVKMKDDVRFPRSKWADDARISYLAKGTAGLLMGISPLTAIERLRKITHKRGHPLFLKPQTPDLLRELHRGQREEGKAMCMCWRCALKRKRERGAILY
jgi:hypothetical protein